MADWCSPYKIEETEIGVLKTPIFLMTFRRGEKVLKAEMLLDTGSDVTVAPKLLADKLGLELKKGIPIKIVTIDGESKAYVHTFTFNGSTVPIAISERDDMPFLLGRIGLVGEVDIKLESEVTCLG